MDRKSEKASGWLKAVAAGAAGSGVEDVRSGFGVRWLLLSHDRGQERLCRAGLLHVGGALARHPGTMRASRLTCTESAIHFQMTFTRFITGYYLP
jgi:hypothetical protein